MVRDGLADRLLVHRHRRGDVAAGRSGAIDAADRARTILTDLGAKPLLERLTMAEHPAPAEAP